MAEGTEPKIDVNKVFSAIAKIIGTRENVDIKVVAVHKKDDIKKKDTA